MMICCSFEPLRPNQPIACMHGPHDDCNMACMLAECHDNTATAVADVIAKLVLALKLMQARLAAAISKRQADMEREQREVQKIREESEELRALEEMIRAAEMNKERKVQLEEKKFISEQERAYNAELERQMDEVGFYGLVYKGAVLIGLYMQCCVASRVSLSHLLRGHNQCCRSAKRPTTGTCFAMPSGARTS